MDLLQAGPERAGDIAALHALLFETPWTASSVARLLEPPAGLGLVAVLHGSTEVAGFILARRAGLEAEILSLGVRRDVQGQGIGRRLVKALADALRAEGTGELYLEVAADNDAALTLYQRTGFREVGRRRRYYLRPDGRCTDALLLAGFCECLGNGAVGTSPAKR